MSDFLQKKEQLKQEAKIFCQDVSKPLEERWKILMEFGDCVAVPDFKFPNINWDGFYYDRWQFYSVNVLIDDLLMDEDVTGKFNETKFREYCCQNFISSIQYSNFLSKL
jgi:hypothetical protein